MLLSCQDKLIPGNTSQEKFRNAATLGFDAIEINGSGQKPLNERVDEIKEAAKVSRLTPVTICGGYASGWIGDFNEEHRKACVREIASMLPAAAEIGASGWIVPAAYGMFSRKLPPHIPPRSPQEDREALLNSLETLGREAQRCGVQIYLEPLNRYEDHMINTVESAVELIRALHLPSVKVMLDLFHGNIEETDLAGTIAAYPNEIAHIHLADSNRLQPGTGHLDFRSVFRALKNTGYKGTCAMECTVAGPDGMLALRETVKYLRGCE